jgi:hypothetical protein
VPLTPPPPGYQWISPCGSSVPIPVVPGTGDPSLVSLDISDDETTIDPESGQSYTYGQIREMFENTPDLIDAVESERTIPPFPSFISWPTLQTVEFLNEYYALSNLHSDWSKSKLMSVALWHVWKNELHFTLDIVGMVPVIGEAADIVNGGIYFLDGDQISGAFSIASAIPVYGWLSTGGKWVKKAITAIPVSSIPGGVQVFRAIKTAKGAVRMIKLPVDAFTHTALNTIAAIKPADNTLSNISRTLVDQLSHRIKPISQSLKSKIDDIVANGDALGNKTEALSDEIFDTNGFSKIDGKFGSNNGFDGIYIKTSTSNNVESIIINEAKQVGTAGNIKLDITQTKGAQMSDTWIDGTISEMRNNADQTIRDLGNLLNTNRNRITKTVTAVDKVNAEIVILKLTTYR